MRLYASALAEKACSKSDSRGCNFMGYRYAKGQGVEKDATKARGFFNKACTLKVDTACAELRN